LSSESDLKAPDKTQSGDELIQYLSYQCMYVALHTQLGDDGNVDRAVTSGKRHAL
jgi:hypothetical protein